MLRLGQASGRGFEVKMPDPLPPTRVPTAAPRLTSALPSPPAPREETRLDFGARRKGKREAEGSACPRGFSVLNIASEHGEREEEGKVDSVGREAPRRKGKARAMGEWRVFALFYLYLPFFLFSVPICVYSSCSTSLDLSQRTLVLKIGTSTPRLYV
ncbi:hypothetical protein FB451DRAFT_45643 [Mycena latifolia]|nr:hypothetical protein FB451DRAFT_45643 [Mycena latifolia]